MKRIILAVLLSAVATASFSQTIVESTSVNTNNDTVTTNSTSVSTTENKNVSVSDSRQSVDQTITSPPPSAIAPTIMSYSQDICMTGVSAAVQTQILGISGGKPIRDMNCENMKLAKTMYDMGMKVAAVSLLCQDNRVFRAMEMAGTPCPYMGTIGKDAQLSWETNPDKKPKEKK
jgi:hypothetical protein